MLKTGYYQEKKDFRCNSFVFFQSDMAFLLTEAVYLSQGLYSFLISIFQAVKVFITTEEKLRRKKTSPKGKQIN